MLPVPWGTFIVCDRNDKNEIWLDGVQHTVRIRADEAAPHIVLQDAPSFGGVDYFVDGGANLGVQTPRVW